MSRTRPSIAIYGATDRINYGDLLFPLILRNAFAETPDFDFKCFGLIESDLSATGALPTLPIAALYDPSVVTEGSRVLVAGGEVLCCDWMAASFYHHGRFTLTGRVLKRLGADRLHNHLIARSYRAPARMPFILTHDQFRMPVQIGYNAVGGSNLAQQDPAVAAYIRTCLDRVDYVSVRDLRTKEILEQGGRAASATQVSLSPDSAVLMRDYYPREKLQTLITPRTRELISRLGERRYLCLQVKQSLLSQNAALIAAQVARIYRELGLPVLLLPIGTAPGHSDDIALKAIATHLSTPHHQPEGFTVYDTMALIAHSAAFIGTSLHGTITSIAFGIPHVVLNARDFKLSAFLDTWDIPAFRKIGSLDGFADNLAAALRIPAGELEGNAEKVCAAARSGMREMAASLGLPEPRFTP